MKFVDLAQRIIDRGTDSEDALHLANYVLCLLADPMDVGAWDAAYQSARAMIQMHDNLTETQERCTQLAEENRKLRGV